jgi:hypothetical protein
MPACPLTNLAWPNFVRRHHMIGRQAIPLTLSYWDENSLRGRRRSAKSPAPGCSRSSPSGRTARPPASSTRSSNTIAEAPPVPPSRPRPSAQSALSFPLYAWMIDPQCPCILWSAGKGKSSSIVVMPLESIDRPKRWQPYVKRRFPATASAVPAPVALGGGGRRPMAP